jgi:hypothetical protein
MGERERERERVRESIERRLEMTGNLETWWCGIEERERQGEGLVAVRLRPRALGNPIRAKRHFFSKSGRSVWRRTESIGVAN